jgi:deferrochelatase/peroxidase EfeB
MGIFELSDIQGNILHGYGFPVGVYTFVRVPDAERGRALLRDLLSGEHLPHVTDAHRWQHPPGVTLNLALTYAGLQQLATDESLLATLPTAFSTPIRDRAERALGDVGESHPSRWEKDLRSSEEPPHLLIMLASSSCDRQPINRVVNDLDDCLKRHDAECVRRQPVAALKHAREHFGYRDGFGQPAIEGVSQNWPGQGTPQPNTGAWNDVKAGEFLLGHVNEDGDSNIVSWLLRNGTYMVYRKLEQNVRAFEDGLKAAADAYVAAHLQVGAMEGMLSESDACELMAAKLVGRWRTGAAAEIWPGPARPPNDDVVDNDFRYGDDKYGYLCPRGAHIRRANPRDLLGDDGTESRRHRILRRGMPYGEPYPEDPAEQAADGGHRGLIFMCFNADLERQFEVIQGQWCSDGNAFQLGDEQDYLLGNGNGSAKLPDESGTVTIGGATPLVVSARPHLVVTRYCEYLLMPGVKALQHLSERLAAAEPHARPASSPDADKLRQLQAKLEQVPAGEADAIARVVELIREEMRGTYASSRPVRRGQHPKSNGLVRAKFIVDVDAVPEELRIGLFQRSGEYGAWIRFSGSHSVVQSDAKPDARGMAIKVTRVHGHDEILWEGDETGHQDFVLVDHKAFFCRDAAAMVDFAQEITASGRQPPPRALLPRVLAFYFQPNRGEWRCRGLRNLIGVLRQRLANPLNVEYWSQTPYALGPQAVKYAAVPYVKGRAKEPNSWDGLEDAVAASLRPADASFGFKFMVQLQTDEKTMPVEDPTVTWSEAESPFRQVARIEIGQDLGVLTPARRNLAERDLSFSPWHSLLEHRPLGGINRVRHEVYVASRKLRHELNGPKTLPKTKPCAITPTAGDSVSSDAAGSSP